MKAALAAALLVVLVAAASATTYTTTTITTTSYEEEGGQQQCSQQMQGQEFSSCQTYLRQRSRPSLANPQQQEQYVDRCCEELREMDRYQCGCEALRRAAQKAQQQGQGGSTGQSEQIYQAARELPRRCGLRHQQCRFNLAFF